MITIIYDEKRGKDMSCRHRDTRLCAERTGHCVRGGEHTDAEPGLQRG